MKIPILATIVLLSFGVNAEEDANVERELGWGDCKWWGDDYSGWKVCEDKDETCKRYYYRKDTDDDWEAKGGWKCWDKSSDDGEGRKCKKYKERCCKCFKRCNRRNSSSSDDQEDCFKDDCKRKCKKAKKHCDWGDDDYDEADKKC